MGSFVAMARLISHLGDQLISNSTVAILELIKNSYDATIKNENEDGYVKIEINQCKKTITIEDNGHGMTPEDIKSKYLVIGTTDRLEQKNQMKKDFENNKNAQNKVPQGEKGLGRFATMKLGEKLVLLTKSKKSSFGYLLGINWNAFGYSSSKQLNDVKTHEFRVDGEKLQSQNYPSSFTKIKIYDIKDFFDPDVWTPAEFALFYKKHFLKFLNPFKPTKGFQIKLELITTNGELHKFTPESLDRKLLEQAPFKIKGAIHGKKVKFIYYIRNEESNTYLHLHSTVLHSVTEKNLSDDGYMGPISFEFYFFDRRIERLKEIKGYENIARVRDLLNQYCGGIMIYRDNFRVLPYAEPGNDWLEVNSKNQFQTSGMKFNTLQTIGTIHIGTLNNPNFRDQTNREGLVKNKAYDNLYLSIRDILKTFKGIIEKYNPKDKKSSNKKLKEDIEYAFKPFEQDFDNVEEIVNNIYSSSAMYVKDIKSSIKLLKSNFERFNLDFEKVKYCVVELNAKVDEVEKNQNLIIDLAGIGMTAESVAHEMRSYLTRIKSYLEELKKLCPKEKNKIMNLLQNTKSLEAVVSRLDIQTVAKRRARSKISLQNTILSICLSKINVWNASNENNIKVFVNRDKDCYIKANEGMIIQVFDNLLNNSHYWLLKHKEDYPKENLEIHVKISDHGIVEFYDNGFGIVEIDADLIFEPFFSRRNDGRGLGLYIVQEALNYHDADIYLSKEKNQYSNYFKFIIDFSKCFIEKRMV